MINARKEFEDHVSGRKVKCAIITVESGFIKEQIQIGLRVGYSKKEYSLFLKSLNFEYDNKCGFKHLHGIIWYAETWSERIEYDGDEKWVYMSYPDIPIDLNNEKDQKYFKVVTS